MEFNKSFELTFYETPDQFFYNFRILYDSPKLQEHYRKKLIYTDDCTEILHLNNLNEVIKHMQTTVTTVKSKHPDFNSVLIEISLDSTDRQDGIFIEYQWNENENKFIITRNDLKYPDYLNLDLE